MRIRLTHAFGVSVALLALACGEDSGDGAGGSGASGGTGGSGAACSPPDALPFEFARPPNGVAPSAAEIESFTKKLTGFWKTAGYFRWYTWLSHGLDASHDPSMPDFGLYWQDVELVKQGDTLVYRHVAGADNLMIRTSKVMNNAAAIYLASGDPAAARLVEQWSKGIVALFQGMVWGGEAEPVTSIMARAVFTHDHEYSYDGRKVKVEYGPVKGQACTADADCPGVHVGCPEAPTKEGDNRGCCSANVCVKLDWNAHTIPNPENPSYGNIWVRNMRSKDDVPHIFRSYPLLLRVARDARDENVRSAAENAVAHLKAFAQDIVDNGYQIRTKDGTEPYVPTQDLASFVKYEKLLPNAECDAKLSSALVASGSALDLDCGSGISSGYETIATNIHYYNAQIIRYFHLASLTNALEHCRSDVAESLIGGLAERADGITSDAQSAAEEPSWNPDMASFLVASAAAGLPLTGSEARIVVDEYGKSADHFSVWPYFDLWASTLPDGKQPYDPGRDSASGRAIEIEEMAYLIEYCWSPWKNPAGTEIVDCSVVLDPSRWGQ